MIPKKKHNRLKFFLGIAIGIAILAVGLIVYAILAPTGPKAGSSFDTITNVLPQQFYNFLDETNNEYDRAYSATYASKSSIKDGIAKFEMIETSFNSIKYNITQSITMEEKFLPDAKGQEKEWIQLSIECDKKRIIAIDKRNSVIKEYQTYLKYQDASNKFNSDYDEFQALLKTYAIYASKDDSENAIKTIISLKSELELLKTDIANIRSIINLESSLNSLDNWTITYGEAMDLTKSAWENTGIIREKYGNQVTDKSILASNLLNKGFSDSKTEIDEWFYTYIDLPNNDATKLLDEANSKCSQAGQIYEEMFP
jgi:hypothetical protein